MKPTASNEPEDVDQLVKSLVGPEPNGRQIPPRFDPDNPSRDDDDEDDGPPRTGLVSYGLFRSQPAGEWNAEAPAAQTHRRLAGDLWLQGELCVLFGDTGKGKSVFATQIADSIARGVPMRPFKTDASAQKVLYFDFEMTTTQFAARYSAPNSPPVSGEVAGFNSPPGLRRGADASSAGWSADGVVRSTNDQKVKPGSPQIRTPHSAFRNSFAFSPNLIRVEMLPAQAEPDDYGFKNFRSYFATALIDQIERHAAKVVVIDNITYLSDHLQSSARAAHMMKELRRIKSEFGLSMLVIGHSPKRRPTDRLTTRDLVGSKMQANFADSMIAIGASLKGADVRYLKQVKARSAAQNHESENVVLFRIEKIGPFLQFTHTGYGRETDHVHLIPRTTPASDRQILTAKALALRAVGKTHRAIAQQLNIPKSTVHTYLKNSPKP